jgi:hypothetical protein
MNTQVFMFLITIVLVIRLFKGFKNRNNEFDLYDEVGGFFAQSIVTVAIYMIVYLGLSFFA